MGNGSGGLFEAQVPKPLADRLRPSRLENVLGQDHLLGPTAPLGRMVQEGRVTSMILWGPPGTGKTTLARLLADTTNFYFEAISAIFSGIADLRRIFDAAVERRALGKGTLLFVDEIHRFNRTQQDGFLPYLEDGTIILVGATTENPSFELNSALLSRCHVLVLNRLDQVALENILTRAEAEFGQPLPLTNDARRSICDMADGDGRYLLNLVEEIRAIPASAPLDVAELTERIQKRAPLYDKTQEAHYNLISALHKSLRGSDVDASLYWFARMLDGGEDPRYILRRLTRFAVEDIGLADPNALTQSIAAWEAYERIGSPEGDLVVAQCVIYLATAPKSNAVYSAFKSSARSAKSSGSLSPPKHILNAPNTLMRDLGYGHDYHYDHNSEEGFSGKNYFPEEISREKFYHPFDRGFERDISERLEYWEKLRTSIQSEDG